jgi:putative transposase
VSAHQAEFPIATMCRVLGISSSGYYAWTTRSPSRRARSNTALTETVRKIHAVSRGTYGTPRVHAELVADGVQVGKNRVARLMHDAGVAGVSRRKLRSQQYVMEVAKRPIWSTVRSRRMRLMCFG